MDFSSNMHYSKIANSFQFYVNNTVLINCEAASCSLSQIIILLRKLD